MTTSEQRLKTIEARLTELEIRTTTVLKLVVKFHPEIVDGFNDWLKAEGKDTQDDAEKLIKELSDA